MSQTRDHGRPTPGKELRSGKYVRLNSGVHVTEVQVTTARFSGIVKEKSTLTKVIANYADTAARAKKTGKPLIVVYRVLPSGKIETMQTAEAEMPPTASPLDAAMARAKSRGAAKIADILKGEDMLTAEAFGELIGASHTTVNAKRTRHEVLGLAGATRGFRYPSWQLTADHMPLPGLAQLFKALGDEPWTVYRFLRTTHVELGGATALDALKEAKIEAVLGVATNQAAGAFS